MNPFPVFLPLTTRGRHLPSSWSHFPKLLTPVTHHTLTCSPLSWPFYSLLTHHSAWINCMCYCVVYCSTLWCMLLRTPALCCILWCPFLFCFLPVGLFVIIKLRFPAFGPRLLFFLCAPCPHRDSRWPNSKSKLKWNHLWEQGCPLVFRGSYAASWA